jgi:hypothetical protein
MEKHSININRGVQHQKTKIDVYIANVEMQSSHLESH